MWRFDESGDQKLSIHGSRTGSRRKVLHFLTNRRTEGQRLQKGGTPI